VGDMGRHESLLKDADENCIGIVNVEPLNGGHFKLHMKRGI
jgi:hypothetical protein